MNKWNITHFLVWPLALHNLSSILHVDRLSRSGYKLHSRTASLFYRKGINFFLDHVSTPSVVLCSLIKIILIDLFVANILIFFIISLSRSFL